MGIFLLTTVDVTTSVTDIEVIPLSGWTGALIDGVDISAPLSDADRDAIRAALHQWTKLRRSIIVAVCVVDDG